MSVPDPAETAIRDALRRALMAVIQPESGRRIPGFLDALGMRMAPDETGLTKAQLIEGRFRLLTGQQIPGVVDKFLSEHGERLAREDRFHLEELRWAASPHVSLSRSLRYRIARGLEGVALYDKGAAFLELVRRLWDRSSLFAAFSSSTSLMKDVERHVVRNSGDWSVEVLFEHLGAFTATDRRFAHFVEGLASSEVRPDEASQRAFGAVVNRCLAGSGIELREVGQDGGFPVFRLAGTAAGPGPAKNLIFASREKPDIRVRDAVSNDIEILSRADEVLVYDLPLAASGLRWSDLQSWWAGRCDLAEDAAKGDLYKRLLSSLPLNSPPQTLLFKAFFRHFGSRVPGLPALLPEVWLHWDPNRLLIFERGDRPLQ